MAAASSFEIGFNGAVINRPCSGPVESKTLQAR